VLSYDDVSMILLLAVSVKCRLVTDRRTDGQRHDNRIYRASIAPRDSNKMIKINKIFNNKVLNINPYTVGLLCALHSNMAKHAFSKFRHTKLKTSRSKG